MTAVPELSTERLLMRGWREEDFEAWTRVCSDAEVMRTLGEDGALSPPEAWNNLMKLAGHWQLKGFGHWALEDRDTGALVGRAGLLRPPDWPDLEVGWMVERARWGEGLAGEAARAAVAWAEEELGARHIISLIREDNSRSQRVAEKLGETIEGRAHLRGHELLVYGADLPLRA
jgi:RimJ/RimL family protein N-acetyltransferase